MSEQRMGFDEALKWFRKGYKIGRVQWGSSISPGEDFKLTALDLNCLDWVVYDTKKNLTWSQIEEAIKTSAHWNGISGTIELEKIRKELGY